MNWPHRGKFMCLRRRNDNDRCINITINRGYHLLLSTFFVSTHRIVFSLFISHFLLVISCRIIIASYWLLIFLWLFSKTHGFVIFSW